jgi:hypothetical protein
LQDAQLMVVACKKARTYGKLAGMGVGRMSAGGTTQAALGSEPFAYQWSDEDFDDTPALKTEFDPWEPLHVFRAPEARPAARARNEGLFSDGDFWDPAPANTFEADAASTDWAVDLPLPDFVPHAAQNPFQFDARLPSIEDKAKQRARWLVSLLDVPQLKQRVTFEIRFTELFSTHPHAATFTALADLALEETSADELWSAFELKELWASTPLWWSMRRRGSRQPLTPDNGANMLGWSRSCRFVAGRKGLPSEVVIDPDWFNDWLELSISDPLYWRFIDYAEARIDAFAAGALEASPPPGRSIRNPSVFTIDGFATLNNYSRTASLARCATDSWASTVTRSVPVRDILTPTKVSA